MGNCASYPGQNGDYMQMNDIKWVYQITNDYELAIRLSKELEYFLQTYFGATGKGLHDYC